MYFFKDFFSNQFLITGISSWLIAQILKMAINLVINKTFDIKRLFGDGGMPSGHSATVASLAATSALLCGMGSFEFAISAILCIIVCNDAAGVRYETGKQAAVLNEIIGTFSVLSEEKLPGVKLKELVGHTPVQVFAGILLGLANAFFMHYIVF